MQKTSENPSWFFAQPPVPSPFPSTSTSLRSTRNSPGEWLSSSEANNFRHGGAGGLELKRKKRDDSDAQISWASGTTKKCFNLPQKNDFHPKPIQDCVVSGFFLQKSKKQPQRHKGAMANTRFSWRAKGLRSQISQVTTCLKNTGSEAMLYREKMWKERIIPARTARTCL